VVADLPDAAAVHKALDASRPDVIVNLAALTDVDACERDPHAAYLAHVRAVENVVAWIETRSRTTYFVQLSTDQVYDGPGPHREAEVTLRNYYAFSKFTGELVARQVPSAVLRTNFFGPSESPGRTSLSDWLVASLTRGAPITVFDDVCFSPLSMASLSRLIARVVERRPSGIFNAGSTGGMSKADFAFELARVLDLPTASMTRGHSSTAALRARRPLDMRMDSSRLERACDVVPPSLSEELHSMQAAYANAR
jgi:dTDP-4-dehydrorhamnose reductase